MTKVKECLEFQLEECLRTPYNKALKFALARRVAGQMAWLTRT